MVYNMIIFEKNNENDNPIWYQFRTVGGKLFATEGLNQIKLK